MKISDNKQKRIAALFLLGIVVPSMLMAYLAFRGIRNDGAYREREEARNSAKLHSGLSAPFMMMFWMWSRHFSLRFHATAASLNLALFAYRLPGISNKMQPYPLRSPLGQNYPDPFNPATRIRFGVRSSGFVVLKVYDVLGREVRTLVSDKKSPGTYEVKFDASGLPSRVYFYKIKAGDYAAVKKMLMIK